MASIGFLWKGETQRRKELKNEKKNNKVTGGKELREKESRKNESIGDRKKEG